MPGRGGDAGDQAATADLHHQIVQVGLRAQHLDADGALPGDHRIVVERIDHRQAAPGRQRKAVRARIVEALAVQHDGRAERARALDLHRRREARHHDGRADAEALRVPGHALRVVAGRHRHHAAAAFGGTQLRQPVQRSALLERGGELQVLELQEHRRAGDLGERARQQARRVRQVCGEARRGSLDVGELDHRLIMARASMKIFPACSFWSARRRSRQRRLTA